MASNPLYNEKEILVRVSEGDEQAFGLLFTHYYPLIYSLVHRFTLNDEDVHEAVQESFLKAWLNRDNLAQIENFQAWMLRVCSRICKDILNKNLLKVKYYEAFTVGKLNESSDTVSNKLGLSDLNRLIVTAVRQMPEQRRRIYQLSREGGMSPAEIADELNISVNTVKNTLVTALKQIREVLAKSGYLISFLFFLLQ